MLLIVLITARLFLNLKPHFQVILFFSSSMVMCPIKALQNVLFILWWSYDASHFSTELLLSKPCTSVFILYADLYVWNRNVLISKVIYLVSDQCTEPCPLWCPLLHGLVLRMRRIYVCANVHLHMPKEFFVCKWTWGSSMGSIKEMHSIDVSSINGLPFTYPLIALLLFKAKIDSRQQYVWHTVLFQLANFSGSVSMCPTGTIQKAGNLKKAELGLSSLTVSLNENTLDNAIWDWMVENGGICVFSVPFGLN